MDDSLSPSGLLFTPFCRSASKKAESSVEDCLKSTWLCSVVACLKKTHAMVFARGLAEVLVGFLT